MRYSSTNAEAEARYAAGKRREALQAVQRLNAALSKGDALSLKGEFAQQLGITDTTDKVQIKQAITVLKERALKWENYFTDPALYQEAHEAAVRQMAEATPLFEQANGSFVASPVNGKTPAPEETLPEELLDISSKPMPDVTKGDTFIALSREGISFADSNKRLKSLKGEILINNATGIEARLSATGANKLVSNAAVAKSVSNGFTRQQHYELASAIDQLFATAILTETRPDQYGDVNVKSIKRFYAPVRIGPGFAAAKITVKESVSHGHRIYSVEEIQITALPPLVRRAVLGNNSAGNAVTIDSVTYLNGEVKQNPVRPYGEGKGVAADGTPVVAGERLVLGGAYPYGGRTMPLGGAPDSPAMQKGLIKLSTFDLVSIYKDLSVIPASTSCISFNKSFKRSRSTTSNLLELWMRSRMRSFNTTACVVEEPPRTRCSNSPIATTGFAVAPIDHVNSNNRIAILDFILTSPIKDRYPHQR
ncbi:MAG: hypothetical protein IJV69_08260 [Kiritimatiellae bacterium]|nr:hypothetical protein [Kiritimatiellia bacterium]